MTTHTFDWHAEPDGSFLHHALLMMMPDPGEDHRDRFNELGEATENFTRVELGVTVNGIPMDAEKFMRRLSETVESNIKYEAEKIIQEMPRLHQLYETVQDFERAFKERVFALAAEAGIEMREDW